VKEKEFLTIIIGEINFRINLTIRKRKKAGARTIACWFSGDGEGGTSVRAVNGREEHETFANTGGLGGVQGQNGERLSELGK